MKINIQYSSMWIVLLAMTAAACQNDVLSGDVDQETDNVINVGVEAAGLSISSSLNPIGSDNSSRATGETKPAEEVSWLVQPLKQGLDITYGKVPSYTGEDKKERVAILKLSEATGDNITIKENSGGKYATNTQSGYAIYTFCYRDDTKKAIWYDNGPHYFEGVHVPNRIRYANNASELENDRQNFNGVENVAKLTNLTTDQSDNVESGTDNELSNYYLLSHYLGMPANTRISATVSRILLPFRHRLAHVLAYIIIDPALGTKINGYSNVNGSNEELPFRDDPKTSDIRFCNVDVLKGVHDVKSGDLHTLTPEWAENVRKVIPHFYEQKGELIVYESTKKKLYPKSEGYTTVNNSYTTAYNSAKNGGKTEAEAVKAGETACGYSRKVYYDIPVYDLIVRPTYTSYDNVMYDEAGYNDESARRAIANKKNKIDFQVGLENGLNYEKLFNFDLDANYETVVYLHISREGVDYNASGSELWQEKSHNDGYYGVDNQNGHTLSKAGSSWQRAYYNTHLGDGDKITDGGFYDEDTAGEDGTKGQYISDNTWIENLREAYKGGKHHGDYFVLAKDTTIDASLLPTDGLVFTGHLDGFNTHGSRGYHKITLTRGGSKVTYTDAMHEVLSKLYVNADCTDSVPELYYEAQIAQSKGSRGTEGIEKGEPMWLDKSKTYPADLTGMVIYTKVGDTYTKYDNRTFYKKCPNYLFAGLDGIYETNQERGQTPWEANVHKEGNYWLPYRDVTGTNPTNTGWRAEVLNLTVEGGMLFKEGAIITGNVENCKDTSGKVKDHTPALPKYK